MHVLNTLLMYILIIYININKHYVKNILMTLLVYSNVVFKLYVVIQCHMFIWNIHKTIEIYIKYSKIHFWMFIY